MFLQPVRDGARLAVAEQVNGPAGLDVDEDGAVVPAAFAQDGGPAVRQSLHELGPLN